MAKIRIVVFLLFGVGIAMIALFAPTRFWNHGIEETNPNASVPELNLPASGENEAAPSEEKLHVVIKPRSVEEIISSTVTEEPQLETSQLTGAYPKSLLQENSNQPQQPGLHQPENGATLTPGTEAEAVRIAPTSTSQTATSFDRMRLPEPMVVSGTQKYEGSRISQGNSNGIRTNGRSISHKRTHVIMDGDTLESIAGRYLRDPNRGYEIYNSNRDVLPSPGSLPIGVKIVIPD